ncbi:MAG: hypothetical protein AVDCRST_MAG03-3213, partial [uncultured Rubrobacteraceae bacterium]
ERGKRSTGPRCWGTAGSRAALPAQGLASRPPGRAASRPERRRPPHGAARGAQGRARRERLPSSAPHGDLAADPRRPGAGLRRPGADAGLGRGGAGGPHRPQPRHPRHGPRGGRQRRYLDTRPSGEPDGPRLPSGGRGAGRDGPAGGQPHQERPPRPRRGRGDAGGHQLQRHGRRRQGGSPDGRPGRRGGLGHDRLLPGDGLCHLHPSRSDGAGGQRRRDKARRQPGRQGQRLPGKERRRRRRQRPRRRRDDPSWQRRGLGRGPRPPALRLHLRLRQPRHHQHLKGRL